MMEDGKKERVHLDVTKSLRPKSFKRKTLLDTLHLNDEERFYENAFETLHTGTFTDLHLRLQSEKYERRQYSMEKRNLEKEAELEKQNLLERSILRQTVLNKHKLLIAENTRKTEEMTEKWKQTQLVKKNRQIRDLQFELTMSRIQDLKKLQQRQIHDKEEKEGIDQFERNMRKLGITSNDSQDGPMAISYETKEAYEKRMKQLANHTMPTGEEVSNFKAQLKERTAANRLARYEKARRRRRAMSHTDGGKNETVDSSFMENEQDGV